MLVWESYDWWAKVDGRQNHLRTVAGKIVGLSWAIGSPTETSLQLSLDRRPRQP